MTRHSARSALLAVTLIFIPTGHALAQDDGSGDLLSFSTSFVADQTWPIHEPVPEEPFANNFLTGGSLAGGTYSLSPLPAGVTFDSRSRRLSGAPTTVTGPMSTTLSGTDSAGTTVTISFMVTIPVNPLHFADSVVADQIWLLNEPVPEQLFMANVLVGGSGPAYTYTLSPLPDGVTFDSMTRRLSGIPTMLSNPTPATLSGTDSDGTEVELMFMISVQNPLRFTSNVVANQVWRVNEPVEEQPFMANSLIGGSGDGYTYALSPVPPGVTFDSMTRRLSGTPTGIRNPRLTTLTGMDSDGTEVELMFMVSIVENRVRVTVTANGMSGTAFTFPEDVGTIRLAVTAELLPAGSTRRGTVSPVMIMAADGFGLSAPALQPDDYLRETPVAGNPALEIPEGVMSRTWMYDLEIVADSVVEFDEMLLFNVSVGGLRESQSIWVITITDPRTASIELTLSPSIIYEDSGSTLGGVTPVVATVRSLTTLARAVDISLSAAGGTAEDTEFSVARTDSRPLDEFGELDQRVLSITRELTITPVMDTVSEGDETVILTASGTGDDTGITAMATLTIRDGMQPDSAPVLSGGINDQRYSTTDAIEPVTLPIATGGNGPLRYSIAPDLPAGLSFDDATRVLSGAATSAGADTFTYTAHDTDSNTADSDAAAVSFMIQVIAPLAFDGVTIPPLTFFRDVEASLTLPEAIGGVSPIAYTLPGISAVTGLVFDGSTRVISGMPANITAGTAIEYGAMDADGATASVDITITVVALRDLTAVVTTNATGDAAQEETSFTLTATVSNPAGAMSATAQTSVAFYRTTTLADAGSAPLSTTACAADTTGVCSIATVTSDDDIPGGGTDDITTTTTAPTITGAAVNFHYFACFTNGDDSDAANNCTAGATVSITDTPLVDLSVVRDLAVSERLQGTRRLVSLVWQAPDTVPVGATITGYEIQSCTQAGFTDCTNRATVTANPPSAVLRFRTPPRHWRVRALTAAGFSPWAEASLDASTPPPTVAPGPVRSLASSGITDTGVTLTWLAPDVDADGTACVDFNDSPCGAGYVVRRGFPDGETPPGLLGDPAPVEVSVGSELTYTDAGLLPGTAYLYEVYATNSALSGASVRLAVLTTGALAVTGDLIGAITEGSPAEVTGDLDVGGIESSTAFMLDAGTATYGTFAIGTNGGWSYSLNNIQSIVLALSEGEVVEDTFTATAAALAADGSAVTGTVTITVTGVNSPPNGLIILRTGTTTVEVGATIALGGGRSDPDDALDDLTIEWTAVNNAGEAAGVFINPEGAGIEWIATVPAGEYTLTLTVTDPGGASDSEQVLITVTGTDPTAAVTTSAVHVEDLDGAELIVTLSDTQYVNPLPDDAFTLTLGNGLAGTTLASFTRNTGTMATLTLAYTGSGIIGGQDSTITVTVANTAHTDTNDLTTTSPLTVNADVAPTFGDATFVVRYMATEPILIPTRLPAATGGNGELAYRIGGALPTGLTFDPVTRFLSGTPTTTAGAEFTYIVGDADGNGAGTDEDILTIAVIAPLAFGAAIAPQTYTLATAVSVALPAATGGISPLTYTLTPALPDGLTFDGAADSRTITGTPTTEQTATAYTYTVTDNPDDPVTVEQTFIIATLPITFDGDTSGGVTEGDTSAITGTLIVTNPGGGSTAVVVQTDEDGVYGLFGIGVDGEWTYTLGGNTDNDAAVNALPAGDEQTDIFTVTAAANAATVDVIITVTGANDPPTAVITAPLDGMDVEHGSTVTLTGSTSSDPDSGQTATLTYQWSANPDVGSFANATAEDTTWTVPASGTAPVTLTLTATDDANATATAQVTVNPVAAVVTFGSGGTTGAVTEDAATITATGALTLTTNSNDKNVVAQTDEPGMYGDFTIDAAGAWTYTLDNADTDTNALPGTGDGATVMDTFTVTASANPASTVTVTITITGVNDAPTITIDRPSANTMVSFAGTIPVTGTGTDPDTGDNANLTYAWTTMPANNAGSFANDAAESTTWTAPSTEMSVTLHLMVSDDDSPAATATAMVSVMVVPVAIVGTTTGSVTEDGDLTAGGDLNIDNPADNANFMAATMAGTYGNFSIRADGGWTYTLDNAAAAVQALAAGAAPTETFTATSAIGGGTQVITITVNGVNDAPTVAISEPTPDAQVEFGVAIQVTGTGTDPDTGQTATLTYEWTTNPANRGSFTNAAIASTTWTAPNTGTADVILILEVSDGTAPVTARVTVRPRAAPVTIAPPVAAGAVTEDGTLTATGTLTVTNPNPAPGDSTAVLDPTETSRYGAFSIILTTGAWTYTLTNANTAVQALAAGDMPMETFTIRTAADPSVTRVVTITVNGANDAPTAAIDQPMPPMTGTFNAVPGRMINLSGSGKDVDTGTTLTYAWTTNPANQGTFANAANANTTWNPPIVPADTAVTLILTVADNAASNPATATATFALTVTEGPAVGGPGLEDSDPNTVDRPGISDATINPDGESISGGRASGMLMVFNLPTDPATGQPAAITHSILTQPTYGIASIDDGVLTSNVDDVWNYVLDNNREVTRNLGPGDSATDTFGVQTIIGDITLNSVVTVILAATTFPNDRPVIVFADGPSMTVDEGEEDVTLDAGLSYDPENLADGTTGLTFVWTQNAADEEQVTLSDEDTTIATFDAPDERTTLRFDLRVTDRTGEFATATLTVRVDRVSERALQKTLAAFGRAFATGTVGMFEDYLSTPARTNTSSFTIGGHKFDMATDPAQTRPAPVGTGRDLSALATPPSSPNAPTSSPVEHAQAQPNLANTINSANLASTTSNGATTSDDTPTATTTLMSGQDLLMKSAFHLNLNDPTGTTSTSWSFWGRATTGNFNGDTDNADAGEEISVDGSVDSGYLGLDYLTPAGTRLGLAIAQSDGEIDYDEVTGGNTTSGDLEAEMTSILPYIQWQPGESTNAWLLLGYGKGDAEISIDGDADEATDVDIDMQMLAFGLRGDLDRAFSRTELSWKASAFAITIESDDQPDLGGVEADSQRLRFAVEGRRPGEISATGGAFTPGWELGMRWEDGDIERGTAADAGLRFDYTNPTSGWSLSGAATSVLFSPEAYDEWTAGVQARIDPGAQGRGITFTLEPGWTKDGRSQQMGMDFSNALGKWTARGLQLQLTGERTERDDDDIGHNIRLTGSLRF